MKLGILTCPLLLVFSLSVPDALGDGLVAHWNFDEGKGNVLHDRSGNKHHGRIDGATWVKGKKWTALRFAPPGAVIDCGNDPGLNITDGIAVEAWIKLDPEGAHGAYSYVVKKGPWVTDDPYGLVLSNARACFYVSEKGIKFHIVRGPQINDGEWHHIVGTFDGKQLALFVDLVEKRLSYRGKIHSDPSSRLTLGASGARRFEGLIGEVRIYNRALSEAEAIRHYQSKRAIYGAGKMKLTLSFNARQSRLAVSADARSLGHPRETLAGRIEVFPQGADKPIRSRTARIRPAESATFETTFDTAGLLPGVYKIQAVIRDAKGKQIGPAATATWRLSDKIHALLKSPGVKWLNNLVAELLEVKRPRGKPHQEWTFTNPRPGWVFIRSAARIGGNGIASIVLDSGTRKEEVMVLRKDTPATLEAMRFLPAGQHKVIVRCEGESALERLTVRATPELIFGKFGWQRPHTPEPPLGWKFMERYILNHVNVVVGTGDPAHEPYVKAWKKQGKRWIVEVGARPFFEGWEADKAYRYWAGSAGLKNPLYDGIIVDEFSGGDERYVAVVEAIRRIHEDAGLKGKLFYPYCSSMYGQKLADEFVKTIISSGWRFSWERYLEEKPTYGQAMGYLESELGTKMIEGWQKFIPDSAHHMIVCFSYMSTIPEFSNKCPETDFKVWMDMQFNYLANHPAYFGLYGLQEYQSGSANQEAIRWAARLYRHYAIEGNTEMLSTAYEFAFRPEHIVNPDFEDGTKGWRLAPAEEGSISAGRMVGLAKLQGRYPPASKGDAHLLTRRNAKKPNAFSQEIKNLTPGKTYSMKMYSADYGDLKEGKSVKKTHAVSITIDGVDNIRERSKQHPFPNYYANFGPFSRKNQPWLNYHWRVFRAKAPTARLTVSDWASAEEPGGPVGQELIFNFVEVQPYFEE